MKVAKKLWQRNTLAIDSGRHEQAIRKYQPDVDFCVVVPFSRQFSVFGCLENFLLDT